MDLKNNTKKRLKSKMDLQCYEKMPNEWTIKCNKTTKSLFKLARNALFDKNYFCEYCEISDYDKNWIQIHIKYNHDESSILSKIFECKKCFGKVEKEQLINHLVFQCTKTTHNKRKI